MENCLSLKFLPMWSGSSQVFNEIGNEACNLALFKIRLMTGSVE